MSDQHQFDPNKFAEDINNRIHQRIYDRMERKRLRRERNAHVVPSFLPGLFLVVIGSIILLDHMGIISSAEIWKFWPVLLILFGVFRLAECGHRFFSVLIIAFGSLFLLGNLGLVHFTWGELWPAILIALGLTMIWGRMSIPKMPNSTPQSPNTVTANALFGGVERRLNMSNFTGGSVTSTFGGVNLDFRAADMEGEEAVLYVEAAFGGIEIIIPERWTAIFEGESIFGGYNDETRPPLPDVPGAAPKKRLILRGHAVFGGITVKN